MRAALLPTPGDPLTLAYWLRNFETWAQHVDELVVLVNGAAGDQQLVAQALLNGRFPIVVHTRYTSQRMGHDGAMRWLLANTEADHVVLCEDDAYVRHPKAVDDAFRLMTSGYTDFVGSPRHEDYAGSPLQVWPRHLTQSYDEVRRGFWPAFLFARRMDLLNTDREYGDRRWNVGETIAGLDMLVTPELCDFVGIAPDYIHLDTLFGTTFQLRAKEPRVELVHHVRLFDAEATEQWVAEDPPWFHVTGLSTLDQLNSPYLPDLDEHGGLWTRRVAWWERMGHELGPFIERTGIRREDVAAWQARFDPWVTWAER